MNTRVNPFANVNEAPVFETKPRKEKPVAREAIEQIARDNNFPSRDARKTPVKPRRKPHYYRTGRNQQFNVKATGETIERFINMADDKQVPHGELLRLALDALERAGAPIL